jgi:hypothetical protein
MTTGETHIFVSYSRVDQSLVTPIVQVIRAIGAGVFQDIDGIPYGKRWRPVIEDSIERAIVVLVFWCAHSRDSDEVRREWGRAVEAAKDVVPTRLDDTPLEGVLAEYQAIDLRALAASHATGAGRNRNLLPGEFERWLRRHVDAEHANHLRRVDSAIVMTAALHVLSVVEARIDRRGGHGVQP